MRRILVTVFLGLAIALVGGGAYYHLAGPIARCECVYPLTVEVVSDKGGIEQVWCEPCVEALAAEHLKARTKVFASEPLPADLGQLEKNFSGRPLTIGLFFSRTVYPLGKERGRYGQRKLVVVAQYKDGKRHGTIVDIPKHDTSLETQTVTVKLP